MELTQLNSVQDELYSLPFQARLEWLTKHFTPDEVLLASSLGAEDQVLTHYLCNLWKNPRIFTLDTGRLFKECHDLMNTTSAKYGFNYEVCHPDADELTELTKEKGPDLFFLSVEDRKACCKVRKINPLRKKLATGKIWISGLRQDQSITREETPLLEWDTSFELLKFNPMVDWNEQQVWQEISAHNIPYNPLHDQGFPSIGCQPCTRAIEPGEDIRAGRWWWENPENRECGLHWDDGKLKPKR